MDVERDETRTGGINEVRECEQLHAGVNKLSNSIPRSERKNTFGTPQQTTECATSKNTRT